MNVFRERFWSIEFLSWSFDRCSNRIYGPSFPVERDWNEIAVIFDYNEEIEISK